MPKKSSKKTVKKTVKKMVKKMSMKSKISKDKYKLLIKKKRKNKISKKDNKLLENELNKKYCNCIKTLKNKYPEKSNIYKNKYGICMNSIYKQRKLPPPYNVSKSCGKYYKYK
tara:strand:- start:225 stop:563 length:339 start_codon:yes stop_codon:yes gene_type:complete